MIFCLPLIFGAEAIWLAPLVTEVVTLIATVALGRMKRLSRNNKHPRQVVLTAVDVCGYTLYSFGFARTILPRFTRERLRVLPARAPRGSCS